MSNIVLETLEDKKIDSVGFRLDYHLTNEDSQQGFFLEVESDAVIANPVSTSAAGSARIDNLTFAAKNVLGDSDYVVISTVGGLKFAAAVQKYPAAVAQDQDLTFVDFATLVDGEYVIITDQSGAEWAIAADKTGASAAPTGARWGAIAAANKAQVDLSVAVATDEEVADAFLTAFNVLAGFNAVVTLADEAGAVVSVLQTVAGACASAESFLADDSAAGNVTIATVTLGADVTVPPTGAEWVAIPAAQRVQVDVSAVNIAVDMAAAFEIALNTMAAFVALVTTDDSAADGTMLLTHADRGNILPAIPYNFDDSGSGAITNTAVNAGIDSSVNITADTITVAALSVPTGRPVVITSAGALPGPLVSGTTYFAINGGAGVYQFATSLANALAGTEINLVDQGDDGATFSFTPVGGVNGQVLFATKQMTNAEVAAAIAGAVFFDVNTGLASTEYVGSIGFDFSVHKVNKVLIKPSSVIGPVTLPANFRPVFTLRLDNPNMKIVRTQVTRRGVI